MAASSQPMIFVTIPFTNRPIFTRSDVNWISGTTANEATEAALLAYPGGVVDRVVKLNNGDYEVHNIGVNWPHHIFVNSNFKVIGAND